MADGDLEALLEEETRQLETFGAEVRERLRVLMREIEQEFREFTERLLAEQGERLNKETRITPDDRRLPSFGDFGGSLGNVSGEVSFDTGSLLGGAIGSAFNAALSGIVRTGGVTPRTVLTAGAHSIGASLGRTLAAPAASSRPASEQMRLSRSQNGAIALQEIARAGKNS